MVRELSGLDMQLMVSVWSKFDKSTSFWKQMNAQGFVLGNSQYVRARAHTNTHTHTHQSRAHSHTHSDTYTLFHAGACTHTYMIWKGVRACVCACVRTWMCVRTRTNRCWSRT